MMKPKHRKAYNQQYEKKRDNGYKLIQLLKQNPDKFHYAYQLYEEYACYNLELSTLIELLHNENDIIRSIAINICYDLSPSVWDEITDEVILLLKDKNIHIVKYALKIIATYPYEKNCLIPFSYLNHKDHEIRITAMELFDSYSLSTLKYMSEYFFTQII